MQQQQIELFRAATFERFLSRHPQIGRVLVWAPKGRIREARIPLRAFAFAFVKIVPDRADQAVAVAREAFERAADQFIRLSVSVHVGGHERANPALVCEPDHTNVPLLG